jgi:hypothetical protein
VDLIRCIACFGDYQRERFFICFGLHHTPLRPVPRAAALICDETSGSLKLRQGTCARRDTWVVGHLSRLWASGQQRAGVETWTLNEWMSREGFSTAAEEPQGRRDGGGKFAPHTRGTCALHLSL